MSNPEVVNGFIARLADGGVVLDRQVVVICLQCTVTSQSENRIVWRCVGDSCTGANSEDQAGYAGNKGRWKGLLAT